MLSRIAESLYWIGRYLERAECTSRLLDAHIQTLLEDPVTDEGQASSNLLTVLGVESGDDISNEDLIRLLGWDSSSPTSMVSAFWGARESARRSREVISTELWETVNTTWNLVRNNRLQRQRASDACHLIRERCATITGLVEGAMAKDQGWQFLVLGRNLERIDMTARVIEAAMYMPHEDAAWMHALRATNAYHEFRLTHQGTEDAQEAAEFLLLDRLFPRSLVFCLVQAEAILQDLDPSHTGAIRETIRLLGAARADLEYRPLHELRANVAGRMAHLQNVCLQANVAVAARYFDGSDTLTYQAGNR